MDTFVATNQIAVPCSKGVHRPTRYYSSLPRPSSSDQMNVKRILYRRSMAMALRSSTFSNPIHDKHYWFPVWRPSSYRDVTSAKQQTQARVGVRINPQSVAKTAGAKGKTPMRPTPSGHGGNRRRDARDIAYGYTGNPLKPQPW